MNYLFPLTIGLAGMVLFAGCGGKTPVIAHRGASYLAPENTVAAAKLAWELDSDAVEVDIYLTTDDRIVVIHDGSTKRTAGIDLTVSASTSEDLRKLDIGSFKDASFAGEKIPFLEEIFATVPDEKELFVEIKCGQEVIPHLARMVESSAIKSCVSIISFDFDTIVETKRVMPDIRCYWLASSKKDDSTGAYLPYDTNMIDRVAEVGLDGLDLHFGGITKAFVDDVHAQHMKCFAWTVDDPDEFRRLVALGIDGITTNRPAWIREQVASAK